MIMNNMNDGTLQLPFATHLEKKLIPATLFLPKCPEGNHGIDGEGHFSGEE